VTKAARFRSASIASMFISSDVLCSRRAARNNHPANPAHVSPEVPECPFRLLSSRIRSTSREVMRSTTAVRPTTGVRESPDEPANLLVRRTVWAHGERRTHRPYRRPAMHPSRLNPRTTTAFPLVRASMVGLEDLNLRPHPYQVSRAKRCADPPFSQVAAERQGRRDAFLAISFQAVQASHVVSGALSMAGPRP
jgi:hypothetical protein